MFFALQDIQTRHAFDDAPQRFPQHLLDAIKRQEISIDSLKDEPCPDTHSIAVHMSHDGCYRERMFKRGDKTLSHHALTYLLSKL